MKEEINKEQLILEAAEAEFLEKGFNNAKTTVIAKKAGVTHAMLHYYFRTKENLFQMVFKKKVALVGSSFDRNTDHFGSFEELISNFVRFHFDFIKENPRLVGFVYNEIVNNPENRKILMEEVAPKLYEIFGKLSGAIEFEIKKGTIRSINPFDLIMNIASINVATFMALPIMSEVNEDFARKFLEERKENNVQFVLNAIRK